MKWIAYGEIMPFLCLPKSVKNVFLVNRLIKTVYAREDNTTSVNEVVDLFLQAAGVLWSEFTQCEKSV